jgi:hypothetical protein
MVQVHLERSEVLMNFIFIWYSSMEERCFLTARDVGSNPTTRNFFTYSLMDKILDCESEDESSTLSSGRLFILFIFS